MSDRTANGLKREWFVWPDRWVEGGLHLPRLTESIHLEQPLHLPIWKKVWNWDENKWYWKHPKQPTQIIICIEQGEPGGNFIEFHHSYHFEGGRGSSMPSDVGSKLYLAMQIVAGYQFVITSGTEVA